MPYVKYDKGSIGNVLHFLYEICGLNVAEHATMGPNKGEIFLQGELFATYVLDKEGFPDFEFVDEASKRHFGNKEWYPYKRNKAIEEWKKHFKMDKLTLSKKIADAVVQELTIVMLPHLNDMLSWEEKQKLNEQFNKVIDKVIFQDKLDKEIKETK